MNGALATALKPAARKPRLKGSALGEQPLQSVQGAGGQQVLAAAPALVAAQQRVLAEVSAGAGLPKNLGERRAIQQAQIQALPGQRVHHVRGIAEQHGARPHIIQGVLQLQGKTRQLALDKFAISQNPAAGRRQGGAERRGVESRAAAPPRAAPTLHTMDERPSGAAEMPRARCSRNRCHAVLRVRLGSAHMRHQRILMVGMAGGFDAEQLPGLGLRAVAPRSATGCAVRGRRSGARRYRRHPPATTPATPASNSTAPAARAACRHCHCKALPVDDVAEIRLADFRAIEAQRTLALGCAARIPDAHALVGVHAAAAAANPTRRTS